MKKFLGLILVLVCLITPAFAEPVSQEVLNQARTQAGLFMDLKNALGLEWLDEYNIYLANPTSSPAPSWASSVDELINKNYLSVAFPTDFTISPTGKEVTISRTITNQGIKDALPIYLPSISISGNTVSLLVQRPAQWVAWEAGLNSKISRDGEGYSDGGLDVLADTILEFGTRTGIEFASDSKIEFINGDGKLIGIDSLEYKDQELDDRFVNVTGDTMTGSLTAPEYRISDSNTKIYRGSGYNDFGEAVRLQTRYGWVDIGPANSSWVHFTTDRPGFYFDKPVEARTRLQIYGTDTYLTATEGKIAGNKIWHSGDMGHGSGLDADTLDEKHASAFALSGHGHDERYVNITGDTMTGPLKAPEYRIPGVTAKIVPSDNTVQLRIQTNLGYVDIGARSSIGLQFDTGQEYFYFNKRLEAKDQIKIYSSDTYLTATEGKIAGNKIWHKGNDGAGSGLDADMLDGKHGSSYVRKPIFIGPGTDLNDITDPGMYFFGGTPGLHGFTNIPPEQNSAFALLVEKTGAGIVQTYTIERYLYPRTWKRTYSSQLNIWGQWYEEGKKLSNLVSTRVFGLQLGSGTFTWYKPSGVTHVIAYVWGSEEFPDEPNGVSSFGDYLYSTRWDEMATGVIDVTGVTSVPVTVADGEVIDRGNGSWRFYNGFVRVEGYSGPPQF